MQPLTKSVLPRISRPYPVSADEAEALEAATAAAQSDVVLPAAAAVAGPADPEVGTAGKASHQPADAGEDEDEALPEPDLEDLDGLPPEDVLSAGLPSAMGATNAAASGPRHGMGLGGPPAAPDRHELSVNWVRLLSGTFVTTLTSSLQAGFT
jgi:hypothetical protein